MDPADHPFPEVEAEQAEGQRKGEETTYVAVGGGFVEIKGNEVVVVTPRFEKIRSGDPAPSATARSRTEQWREEQKEFQKEMVGYL